MSNNSKIYECKLDINKTSYKDKLLLKNLKKIKKLKTESKAVNKQSNKH